MKTLEERKQFNNNLFNKILDFIEYLYPNIYEESREEYIKQNEDRFKLLKDKTCFQEDYNSWFLTKMILPNGVNVVNMIKSFPKDYFTKEEKKMIKNLSNYIESIFIILTISKDNKNYEIMDFADNKIYKIKTFDLPDRFKKNDIITAFIVKNIEDNFFFFGGIISYDKSNTEEFVPMMLMKFNLERIQRKEIDSLKIEWEIETK
jgi:hypothetical protein